MKFIITTWTCVLGQFCPGERSSAPETWHHAGDPQRRKERQALLRRLAELEEEDA